MYEVSTKHVREYFTRIPPTGAPFDVLRDMVMDAREYARLNGCDEDNIHWGVREVDDERTGTISDYLYLVLDLSSQSKHL